jgi:hypothetical protein
MIPDLTTRLDENTFTEESRKQIQIQLQMIEAVIIETKKILANSTNRKDIEWCGNCEALSQNVKNLLEQLKASIILPSKLHEAFLGIQEQLEDVFGQEYSDDEESHDVAAFLKNQSKQQETLATEIRTLRALITDNQTSISEIRSVISQASQEEIIENISALAELVLTLHNLIEENKTNQAKLEQLELTYQTALTFSETPIPPKAVSGKRSHGHSASEGSFKRHCTMDNRPNNPNPQTAAPQSAFKFAGSGDGMISSCAFGSEESASEAISAEEMFYQLFNR